MNFLRPDLKCDGKNLLSFLFQNLTKVYTKKKQSKFWKTTFHFLKTVNPFNLLKIYYVILEKLLIFSNWQVYR